MRYFNKHRRGLMKQGYKVGTKATTQTSTSNIEIEGVAASSPHRLKVDGNSRQRRYSGYNLFDANSAILSGCTLNDDGSISLNTSGACVDIPLMAGKYIISLERDFTSGSTWLRNGKVSNGYIVRLDTDGEASLAKSFVFDASYDGYLRMQIYATGTISNIQIASGDEVKPYEPYVGGGVSPNPNYPQPIEAVSDFKLSAIGSNLFDIDKVNGADKWTTTTPNMSGSSAFGFKSSDNSLCSRYGIYGTGTIWTGAKIPIKQGGNYFLSCEAKINSTINTTATNMTFGLRNYTKSTGVRTKGIYFDKKDEWVRVSLGSLDVPDEWAGDDIYLSTQIEGNATQFSQLPVYFRNVMLTHNEHTDYEPYCERETSINGVALLGIENAIDALNVDYSSKKVFKTERVLYARVSDLIDEYGAEFDGNGAIYINGALPRMDAPENQIPYFCTHFKSYQSDLTINEENPCFEITASGQIWFYYPPKRTALEFKEWCEENDVKIAYALLNERQIDITNSECGKSLLSFALPRGKAVVFEIKSEITPKSVTLEYYSKEKEDKRKITVHYNDTDGNAIYESNEYFVRRDSLCVVTSPKVEGYEPKNESTFVYLSNDTEITLIYNKK